MIVSLQEKNLPFETTDPELPNYFNSCETVLSAKFIADQFTGRAGSLEIVEIPNQEEAKQTINPLLGTDLSDRILVINEVYPLKED